VKALAHRRVPTPRRSAGKDAGGRARALPSTLGVATFFYYDDLRSAVDWYETRLGLRKVFDGGWVAIFRISGRAHLGLVDASSGSQSPVAGQNKGALLAVGTGDLAAWFRHVRKRVPGQVVGKIHVGSHGLTRQFQVRDPGGYIVEFFQWARR
jgi:catechol 2,3-dioxygenase-like lactoylglutathione lyase family enzyme